MVVVTGRAAIARRKAQIRAAKAERQRSRQRRRSSSNGATSSSTEITAQTTIEQRSFFDIANDVTNNLNSANINSGVPGWWQRLDRYFGGNLPGGYTKLQDEYLDTRQNTGILKVLNPASNEYYNLDLERNRDKAVYKQQLDLLKKSWYEQFGLFQDNQEQIIQNLQRKQAYGQEGAIQLPATVKAIERYETIIKETPGASKVLQSATPSTNWGKIALIGGLGIALVMLIKKR